MSSLAHDTLIRLDAAPAYDVTADALVGQLRRMERVDATANVLLGLDGVLLMAALLLLQDMRYVYPQSSPVWQGWINPALTIAAALLVVVAYCLAVRARHIKAERKPGHPRPTQVPQIVSNLSRTKPQQLRSWYEANADLVSRKGRVMLLALAVLLVSVLPVGMAALLAVATFR